MSIYIIIIIIDNGIELLNYRGICPNYPDLNLLARVLNHFASFFVVVAPLHIFSTFFLRINVDLQE